MRARALLDKDNRCSECTSDASYLTAQSEENYWDSDRVDTSDSWWDYYNYDGGRFNWKGYRGYGYYEEESVPAVKNPQEATDATWE